MIGIDVPLFPRVARLRSYTRLPMFLSAFEYILLGYLFCLLPSSLYILGNHIDRDVTFISVCLCTV